MFEFCFFSQNSIKNTLICLPFLYEVSVSLEFNVIAHFIHKDLRKINGRGHHTVYF
jgi:hypothetical protein